MVSIFTKLGNIVVRRPWAVIVAWAISVTVLGGIGILGLGDGGLFDRVKGEEPKVAGSESAQGWELLTATREAEPSTLLIQVEWEAERGSYFPELIQKIADSSAVSGVFPAASTANRDLLMVTFTPDHSNASDHEAIVALVTEFGLPEQTPAASFNYFSTPLLLDDFLGQMNRDLISGELIALPIALIVMVLVFGGFLAAGVPMAGALASIGGGLGVLFGFTYLMEVDSAAVNVVTVLGIGLSIDYGLLIVSRFREELTKQPAPAAIVKTLATAGRTVVFSGITVAVSVSAMLLFNPSIIRAIGGAALGVILMAVGSAITLVPATLALLAPKLERASSLTQVPLLARVLSHTADVTRDEGFFSRLARWVQRRPWWVLGATTALLVTLALPTSQLNLRNSGVEMLPESNPGRQLLLDVPVHYPELASPLITVLVPTSAQVEQISADIEALPEVLFLSSQPVADTPYLALELVIASDDAASQVARDTVHQVRELWQTDTAKYALNPDLMPLVTGPAALQVDFQESLIATAPWAFLIVVIATLLLLFLMTGSVLIPIKALLTNSLSIAATVGVTIWIFQLGNLTELLDFTALGGIESYVLVLIVAFGFGLAMDYEVFLLARIQEARQLGADNDTAVRFGLQRSGRIITSAALVLVIVFSGFVFGDLLVIKEVGFGLAFAVLLDATVVRMLLVPATMTLLGKWNWWAPRPLQRLHAKYALVH